MTSKITNSSETALTTIKKADNVLLHCHPFPDPDSVCSVLAMTKILKSMDKNVTAIAGDSGLSNDLAYLPNLDWIKPEKITELNLADFDLFIILDSSSLRQVTQLTELALPQELDTLVIDHHASNTGFGKLNIVDENFSSTSHILYELFNLWGQQIDSEIALYLFLGIFADTGGFKFPTTTAETLRVASELVKINPSFHKAVFEMENNRSPKEIEYMGLALSSLEKYFSETVVMAVVPYGELQKRGITKEYTQVGIGTLIRSVVGWNIGINFVELGPGEINISMRSRNPDLYDVSAIAKAVGTGGGGHKAAAGTTIYDSFETAKKQLLDTIGRIYPQLGSQ